MSFAGGAMNENIVIKTEADFDFVVNYQSAENSHSSTSDTNFQYVYKSADLLRATTAVQQKQPQQLQPPPPQKKQKLCPNEVDDSFDDVKLHKLLKEFDLEILYTTLKLSEITYRSLQYLSVEDINTAIRNIGYRAEFREKLFAWRKDKMGTSDTAAVRPSQSTTASASNRLSNSVTSKSTLPTTAVAPTVPMPQTTFLNAINPVATTATMGHSSSSNVASTSASLMTRSAQERTATADFLSLLPGVSATAATSVMGTPTSVVLEQAVDIEEALNFMPSTSQAHSHAAKSHTEVKPITFDGVLLPKGTTLMSCAKVHVQNLLESTHIGRTIKQFYNKNGYLENQQRNEIVRIIIEEVMQQGENLSPKDFRAILDDIIKVFPNEKAAADYYFIYRSGKGNPLGRLYQRYSNENSKRRKLTRLTEDDDCSDGDRQSSLLDDDDTVAYPLDLPGKVPKIDEMTALALKQLLTTEHFNWEEVCDKWIQTWALRQKELQQSGLAELISNWIKLADPRAAELFKIDFRYVYPDKENLLLSKWDDFVKKISMQYDKKLNYDEIKKLYKYCKMGMASKDEKDFVYAVGLTALLPSTARFKDQTGKLRIRANVGDSVDAFVMRLNSLDAYESHLELYNRKFGPINRSAHPILVVITPNDYTITKIYVALENRFYCMQSFLQALDLCYKIYHTCGLKYPTVCENVWTFIQRYFFDMTVPWEARNANLVALMVSLSVHN